MRISFRTFQSPQLNFRMHPSSHLASHSLNISSNSGGEVLPPVASLSLLHANELVTLSVC